VGSSSGVNALWDWQAVKMKRMQMNRLQAVTAEQRAHCQAQLSDLRMFSEKNQKSVEMMDAGCVAGSKLWQGCRLA